MQTIPYFGQIAAKTEVSARIDIPNETSGEGSFEDEFLEFASSEGGADNEEAALPDKMIRGPVTADSAEQSDLTPRELKIGSQPVDPEKLLENSVVKADAQRGDLNNSGQEFGLKDAPSGKPALPAHLVAQEAHTRSALGGAPQDVSHSNSSKTARIDANVAPGSATETKIATADAAIESRARSATPDTNVAAQDTRALSAKPAVDVARSEAPIPTPGNARDSAATATHNQETRGAPPPITRGEAPQVNAGAAAKAATGAPLVGQASPTEPKAASQAAGTSSRTQTDASISGGAATAPNRERLAVPVTNHQQARPVSNTEAPGVAGKEPPKGAETPQDQRAARTDGAAMPDRSTVMRVPDAGYTVKVQSRALPSPTTSPEFGQLPQASNGAGRLSDSKSDAASSVARTIVGGVQNATAPTEFSQTPVQRAAELAQLRAQDEQRLPTNLSPGSTGSEGDVAGNRGAVGQPAYGATDGAPARAAFGTGTPAEAPNTAVQGRPVSAADTAPEPPLPSTGRAEARETHVAPSAAGIGQPNPVGIGLPLGPSSAYQVRRAYGPGIASPAQSDLRSPQGERISAARNRVDVPSAPSAPSANQATPTIPTPYIVQQPLVALAPTPAGAGFDRFEGELGAMKDAPRGDVPLVAGTTTQTTQATVEAPRTLPDARMAQHTAQQLLSHAQPMREGTVEISLRPEELGRIRMTLALSDGAVSVSLLAERGETADLMRRNLDILSQEFRQLGYRDISFDFGEGQPRQDSDAEQDLAFGAGGAVSEEQPDDEDVWQGRTSVEGGVDIRL
ncbi:flagellar hook-length control protein FliK [Candidatus Rhodobacter oscarellae]|nr:flagellar hook-length control protein FliK [Candidatus Rhodobacter lobularis]